MICICICERSFLKYLDKYFFCIKHTQDQMGESAINEISGDIKNIALRKSRCLFSAELCHLIFLIKRVLFLHSTGAPVFRSISNALRRWYVFLSYYTSQMSIRKHVCHLKSSSVNHFKRCSLNHGKSVNIYMNSSKQVIFLFLLYITTTLKENKCQSIEPTNIYYTYLINYNLLNRFLLLLSLKVIKNNVHTFL
jgi:hypothetical protein